MEKSKIIGLGLMAPAAVLGAYLILNKTFWIVGIFGLVFTCLALVGYHIFKGKNAQDAVNAVVTDVTNEVKK